MKTENTEDTLITFHIGRGGRFNNAGHKSYVDQDRTINSYTDDLFVHFENYLDVLEKIDTEEKGRFCDLITDLENNIHNEDILATLAADYGITLADLGKLIYVDLNGSPVGLDYDNDGTGTINIDNEYDTTIVCRLQDVSEEEARLILTSNNYVGTDVQVYLIRKFDIANS
jgi:hypothetical protein